MKINLVFPLDTQVNMDDILLVLRVHLLKVDVSMLVACYVSSCFNNDTLFSVLHYTYKGKMILYIIKRGFYYLDRVFLYRTKGDENV
jgi:hypothetical protein